MLYFYIFYIVEVPLMKVKYHNIRILLGKTKYGHWCSAQLFNKDFIQCFSKSLQIVYEVVWYCKDYRIWQVKNNKNHNLYFTTSIKI